MVLADDLAVDYGPATLAEATHGLASALRAAN